MNMWNPRDPDFWRVSEDEPGPGGVLIAFAVLVFVLAVTFILIWTGAPQAAFPE